MQTDIVILFETKFKSFVALRSLSEDSDQPVILRNQSEAASISNNPVNHKKRWTILFGVFEIVDQCICLEMLETNIKFPPSP